MICVPADSASAECIVLTECSSLDREQSRSFACEMYWLRRLNWFRSWRSLSRSLPTDRVRVDMVCIEIYCLWMRLSFIRTLNKTIADATLVHSQVPIRVEEPEQILCYRRMRMSNMQELSCGLSCSERWYCHVSRKRSRMKLVGKVLIKVRLLKLRWAVACFLFLCRIRVDWGDACHRKPAMVVKWGLSLSNVNSVVLVTT